MPEVRCPYCQKVLASAFTERRARELAKEAEKRHVCQKAEAAPPTVAVDAKLDEVLLHDRR